MTCVRLDVVVERDSEPIHGMLDDRRGPTIEFNGWLELMSAIDTARARSVAATTLDGDGEGEETQGGSR